jgi:hypothetical protein
MNEPIESGVFPETDKHFITLWMIAGRYEGETVVNASYEMPEVGWFRWSELPEPLFPPFRKIVEDNFYKSVKRAGTPS